MPDDHDEPDATRAAGVTRLIDVARAAGVSTSTAGRVLRGSSLPVAAVVAERVRGAAARLGYVPNLLARGLRGAQPRTVGLVVGDMLDPYYGEIAESVTQQAEAQYGLLAIVCNMQRDPRLEIKYCRQLWEHRVAGLILSGGGFDQHRHADELSTLVQGMQKAGVAVATLGPRFIEAPIFSVSNAQVGRLAALSLVEAGHREIGVISGSPRSETARLRLDGVLAALAGRGLHGTVSHAEYEREPVIAAAAALFAAQPGITGVVAGSDFMARALIDWLQAHGRRVPQDVSVVSIGNTHIATARPRLTTIDLQLPACASGALAFIAARAESTAESAIASFAAPEARLVAGETLAIRA